MNRTILLADDSVTIQKVIELTFMEEDYEVVSVSDGDEAIERLAEVAPDIVIADVHMPGASGIDVCRRAKELRPEVPVLLLVGTFEPFDQAAAEDAGADAHLKKPFDSQELLQLVDDLMGPPIAQGEETPGTEQPTGASGDEGGEPEGGESAGDDTWGFSAAAADLAAGGETPQPDPEVGWADALEDLPEEPPEPAPAAASQSEEPAPAWESQAEEEAPSGDAGEPFELRPFESEGRAGEVFDLGAGAAEETPAEWAGEPPPAPEPPAEADADAAWEPSWGFEGEEPAAAAEPPAAAEPEPPAADTGWEEVAEEPAAAAAPELEEPPEVEEPPQIEEPAAVEEPAELHEPAAVAPGWGTAEIEKPSFATAGGDDSASGVEEPSAVEAVEEAADSGAEVAEPVPGSGAAYGAAEVGAGAGEPVPESGADAAGSLAVAAASGLSDHDVDRIARRVAELLGERVAREVAWEVVPDLAEVVIRERLRELEGQID